MKSENEAIPEIILEQWRKRKDETYAVKLRVTYKKRNKTWILKYPLLDNVELAQLAGKTIAMTPKEFERASGKIKSKKYEQLSLHFGNLKTIAWDIIKKMKPFSFEEFEQKFFSKPKDKDDLFTALEAAGEQLRKDGRISTAVSYECALRSLKEFTGKEKLPFELVTVKFLKDYEQWMLTPRVIKWKNKKDEDQQKTRTNSRTTIGIYLRNVRTVFNEVKPVGVPYPFGKTKQGLYQIPKGKNTKKALTQAVVAKIAAYDAAKGTLEQRSRDFWLFSYLCNGINVKDMVRLKYANIKGDKIILIRAKTADSVDEETPIDITITKQIRRIIDTWGNKPAIKESYIFPILQPGMTPEEEYRTIQQAVQTINKNMTRICKHLKIDRATTYTARHSFATVLKRSGASVEFISESLGHKNKQTTQNYLANFEDEEKKKWANMLLPDSDQ
jgi:integrase